MAGRSLQASPDGIKKAKQAFERRGWTQEYLAAQAGIETRQPIWKFFKGKPVDRRVFIEICFQLDLDVEVIAAPPQVSQIDDEPTLEPESTIEELVTHIRHQRSDKIQHQCGTLRLLDIARPVGIEDLYIEVNLCEEIAHQRWLDITDFQNNQPTESDDIDSIHDILLPVPGFKVVEQYDKLMVLGKPGAGKTTFLQYLAIQCDCGKLQPQKIPIFISLKRFAEDAVDEDNINLIDYLYQELNDCGVSAESVKNLLESGNFLILLDGLDEVPVARKNDIIKAIRQLLDKCYKNQFVITCRIAAIEYRFREFTEVELADFKSTQVENYIKKWFVAVAKNSPDIGLKKATAFIEQLRLPEHQKIRELAATPILLNLICLVFQTRVDFPSKRCDLYKQGLELLLTRWDETRGIQRDEIYRNLSLPYKLQMLSQIAAKTFEREEYIIAEETLTQLIADYLRTLPGTENEATLELDSQAVLKAIEAQHGLLVERSRQIYSFSHLTFHEYLTAKDIISRGAWEWLTQHLTEKRWREVFLLTSQMSPNADTLLQQMKQCSDRLTLTHDSSRWQQFLTWLMQKSAAVQTTCKRSAVRAFYFTLAFPPNHTLARDPGLALAIDPRLASESGGELALDLALIHALSVAVALTPEIACDRLSALQLALDLDRLTGVEPMRKALLHLKHQLPQPQDSRIAIYHWWQDKAPTWISNLRAILLEYRHIGYEWHWDLTWQQQLDAYYYANTLLVECLNTKDKMRSGLGQKIEETLLLPMSHDIINPSALEP